MQVRLAKLESEEKRLKEERDTAEQARKQCANQLASVRNAIQEMIAKERDPVITEHAMLRYFERILGFNLDEVKKEILTDDLKALVKKLGDGKYTIGGKKMIVRGNVIVTIE